MVKGRLKGVAKAAALCVAACGALVAGRALCQSAPTDAAGEPLRWERRPGRPAPAQFDTFHGETLQFVCAFEGFGELPFPESGASAPRLYYQTNGMGTAWWSVPATVAGNVLSAAWPPGADPGADRVAFFFGAPSNAYAAAQVRFRNSPGGAPNALPPPTMVLDFANIAYTNAPWATTDYTDSAVRGLKEDLMTGVTGVQRSQYADGAGYANEAGVAYALESGDGRRSAASIFAALDRPGLTTNDVCGIVTNEIVEYGHWGAPNLPNYLDVPSDYEGMVLDEAVPLKDFDTGTEYWDVIYGIWIEGSVYDPQWVTVTASWDAVSLDIGEISGLGDVTITRTRNARNTLGLATLGNLATVSNALSGGVTRADLSNGVAALTVGYRRTGAIGMNSFAQGRANFASGENSFVAGDNGYATMYNSMALGLSPFATNNYAYVWNGTPGMSHGSHGPGSYSINPVGGAYGLYIGGQNLYTILAAWIANKSAVSVEFEDDEGNASVRTFQPLGVATAADLARVEGKADTVAAFVQGDDVKEVITNYDSVVHMPSRSLEQRVEVGEGSNEWRVIWNELTRWDWFLGLYGAETNALWAAIDEKADRAWGCYDSHTGGFSPDGYLQISAPMVLIAAGMAYQRHLVSGGAVWVLESNGLETEVGGVASNGFFRISDDDGAALFEIVKGGKRTVGSTAADIAITQVMGVNHCFVPYNVESDEPPKIYAGTALGQWTKEDSADSIVNVAWTGEKGAWVAEVWPKVATSSLFIKAEHEVGGETYIRNAASTDLAGGVMFNGVRYRVVPYAAADGKTYLTLEAWR